MPKSEYGLCLLRNTEQFEIFDIETSTIEIVLFALAAVYDAPSIIDYFVNLQGLTIRKRLKTVIIFFIWQY